MYLWDADRSSWSRPISLYEVTLVSRQQVILHCFYEEIFTSVVVLYQSFFLYNLKQIRFHSRWRYSRLLLSTQAFQSLEAFLNVITPFIKSLCCCNTCLKCGNSGRDMSTTGGRRAKIITWETGFLCVTRAKKSVVLKDLHVGTLIVAAGPQTWWLMHKDEQTDLFQHQLFLTYCDENHL